MLWNEEENKNVRVNLPVYLKSWMFLEERCFGVTGRRCQKDCPAFGLRHLFFLLNSVRGVAEVLERLSMLLLWLHKDAVLRVLVNERSYWLQQVDKC